MKVFYAVGYVPSGCGCCGGDDYHDAVVATTALEGLGLILEEYTNTKSEHWDISEIDQTHPNVHGG